MEESDAPGAVTRVFLRNEGELLVVRSRDGVWDALSLQGTGRESDDEALRRQVAAVTGVDVTALVVARRGDPQTIETSTSAFDPGERENDHQPTGENEERSDGSRVAAERTVRPVLIDSSTRQLPDLSVETRWIHATALRRCETAPGLWTSYDRVAPTVRSIAADDEHGAATLSIRALEVLRDRAGVLVEEGESDPGELIALAQRLLRSRPSMAVVRNRLARVLATGEDPAGIESAAIDGIERATAADREAAFRAAGIVDGATVLTLSRSGTVLEALGTGTAARVFVAESRPAMEGVDVATALADELSVTVHTDAAVAHVLATESIEAVLVGADTILPDGRVVNKTGTRAAALAASREDVPVYAVAATDKITTRESVNLESGNAGAVYDGDAAIDVLNPTFDVTPAAAIEGIITEQGVLSPDTVMEVAEELEDVIATAGF